MPDESATGTVSLPRATLPVDGAVRSNADVQIASPAACATPDDQPAAGLDQPIASDRSAIERGGDHPPSLEFQGEPTGGIGGADRPAHSRALGVTQQEGAHGEH